MLYAFLFFQHVVKFITPGNDFLTVLGKEKESGGGGGGARGEKGP